MSENVKSSVPRTVKSVLLLSMVLIHYTVDANELLKGHEEELPHMQTFCILLCYELFYYDKCVYYAILFLIN